MTQLTKGPPRQREQPYRSEAYRRHVASLPCRRCGIQGHSQAAHVSSGNFARGMKAGDDLCISLCGPHYGEDTPLVARTGGNILQGHHAIFDSNQKKWAQRWWGLSIDKLKAEAKAAWEIWKETQ